MTGKFGYTTLNNAIVQDIVVVLVAVFSIVVAKTIHKNGQDKLDQIHSMMQTTDSGISSIHEVDSTVASGKNITSLLSYLQARMSEMNKISKMIENVANSLQDVIAGIQKITAEITARRIKILMC